MNQNQNSDNTAGAVAPAAPCSLCGISPEMPELWTDASGNHSENAIIACGCGVQVSIPVGSRYAAKKGDTGWSMISGNWKMSLDEARDKWDRLHQANDQSNSADLSA